MAIVTKHSVLGFLSGIIFILVLEAGAVMLFMNSFGTNEGDVAALDAPPLPTDLRLEDLNATLADLDGRQVNFADLRGKVVVLNLWATWCPPCRAEMPSLENLWRTFKDEENVAVICVSEEAAEDVRVHPFTASVNMPLYVFASETPEELNTSALPTTYIFDRTGRMVFTHTGMAQWDAPHVVSFLRDQSRGEERRE